MKNKNPQNTIDIEIDRIEGRPISGLPTFTSINPSINPSSENSSFKPVTSTVAKKSPNRFLTTNDKDYFFSNETIDTIPSGFYNIKFSNERGVYAKKSEIVTDNILVLPNMPHKKILSDIENFWSKETMFKKYDLVFKRGILLHGTPGGGKSSMIQLLVKDIISRNGIAFELTGPDYYSSYIKLFREVEPNRPVLVIIEDIDEIINEYGEKEITNILDGINQVSKVVYLATTNNISKLDDKIKKRPSRFDRVIEIKKPEDIDREFYFLNKIEKDDIEKMNIDISKWVKDTEGLTISHLKELVISVVIMGNDYEETVEVLKTMKSGYTGNIGFTNRNN